MISNAIGAITNRHSAGYYDTDTPGRFEQPVSMSRASTLHQCHLSKLNTSAEKKCSVPFDVGREM